MPTAPRSGPRCCASASFADLSPLQVDEELLRQQQEAYKVAGVDENEEINPRDRKKRKQLASGDDVSAVAIAPESKATER